MQTTIGSMKKVNDGISDGDTTVLIARPASTNISDHCVVKTHPYVTGIIIAEQGPTCNNTKHNKKQDCEAKRGKRGQGRIFLGFFSPLSYCLCPSLSFSLFSSVSVVSAWCRKETNETVKT